MIRFLYMHVFYAKKRIFLVLAFLGFIALMVLFVYTSDSSYEQRLFHSYYQLYYEQMMIKLLTILLPFFVVLLTMDHDQSYLKPLISYFGRTNIAVCKIILYLGVLLWLYIMIFLLYQIIPFLMTDYYTIDFSKGYLFFHLYLDGLIILVFVLFFIREKHKSLAIIIPVFYLLFTFLKEDSPSLTLFYLLPIYCSTFSTYTLAYLYKACYIYLGFALIVYKAKFESIK